MSDIPSFSNYDPRQVAWSHKAISDIFKNYDYGLGVHEVLFSGSVGSAKSLTGAHIAIRHAIENPGANWCIGRLTLPDLKDTIFQMLLDHMEEDFVEGEDYEVNHTRAQIHLYNGSSFFGRSWADKKFKKFRSHVYSGALIEEITENDTNYWPFYTELRQRVGRQPTIKKNLILALTNPDSPAHPAYKHFIATDSPLRHVYYSLTKDNKFLPDWYIKNLYESMSRKEAERMLEGVWNDLIVDRVYTNYDREVNFKDEPYQYQQLLPLDIYFDFNIAAGKPMSAGVGQKIGNTYHAAKSFITHGGRTLDTCEEIANSGILDLNFPLVRVFGDETGSHRDTRNKYSDYDIIDKFFSNHPKVRDYKRLVPQSNPPIRKRHNTLNSRFKNSLGQVNFYCYDDKIDEGLRLTKLKPGSTLTEDDSYEYQHITTALGYWAVMLEAYDKKIPVNKLYQRRGR